MGHIIDVLIVEDREDWQKRLQELVGNKDKFTIDTVPCPAGKESCIDNALAKIKRRFYYCAIVDKSLILDEGGNEDGMRVLETLAMLDEGTQRLMVTAYGSIPSAREALQEWKVSEYIEKGELANPQKLLETREKISNMIIKARNEYQERYGSGIRLLTASLVNAEGLIWEDSIINALSEPGKGGGYQELAKFLDELLFELAPLIPHISGGAPKLDKQTLLVEGKYWSKGIGEPVVICFGRKNDIERKKREFGLGENVIIRQVSRGIYEGLILKSDLNFEEFSF